MNDKEGIAVEFLENGILDLYEIKGTCTNSELFLFMKYEMSSN